MEIGKRAKDIRISTGIWDWEGQGIDMELVGWEWKLGIEFQGHPQGFGIGKGAGDANGAGGVGDVIPSRINCTKGSGREALGKTPGVGAGAWGGSIQGKRRDLGMLQHGEERAGKRLQLHWIIEWGNG